MKTKYSSVEEYIHDIYDNLYPRAKVAANLLIKKRVITKYDFEATRVPVSQAPRAIRNLKDHGISVETLKRVNVPQAKSKVNRYTLGSVDDIDINKKCGRMYNPTNMKNKLVKLHGSTCVFCGKRLVPKERELDHKLPVNIFGDLSSAERLNPDNYQLVCRKCNRLKREAASHGAFDDWREGMDVVKHNYWYDPVRYRKNEKDNLFNQSIIIWNSGEDIQTYNQIAQYAKDSKKSFSEALKSIANLGLEVMKSK